MPYLDRRDAVPGLHPSSGRRIAHLTRSCLALSVLLVFAAAAGAQEAHEPGPRAGKPTFEPTAPQPPEVIARDSQGRVTVRATRIASPLVIDGALDEEVYASVHSFGDLIQQEPHEGQPGTEKTEMWIFFDEQNVYVSGRFWYAHPEQIRANEMRKDATTVWQNNDSIGIVLDTFFDHRSGVYLNTNALGALRDGLLTDENRNANMDYDLVWDVMSRRFEHGWQTEIAIPFKSLRYPAERDQVWGFNVQRIDRETNELSYLSAVPASYGGAAIWKLSSEATLAGIQPPLHGGNVELKPYALASLTTDHQATPAVSNDLGAAVGFDAKYKITKSLNVDVTVNTDFAQVEVDNQQVNLTRFGLFYPEKRDFFLETQNTFSFGFSSTPNRAANDPTPILFFSRQIGLSGGVEVPIAAGGRLTGRVGPYTVGALAIRARESPDVQAPATTFTVLRVRRDIFSRSTVGIMATERFPAAAGSASNDVFGVDAGLRLFRDVEVNGYYARSRTPFASGDESSYLGEYRYTGDRYGAELARLKVGSGFNPEVGFLPRRDFIRNFGTFRFSPRPKNLPGVRKLSWEGTFEDYASTIGLRQTRIVTGLFKTFWDSGDELTATYTQTDDRPQATFAIAGATISPGSYQFGDAKLTYLLGSHRPLAGTATISRGRYYDGHRTGVTYSGRVSPMAQFMVEPILTLDWLDMPQGALTARIVSARATYTMSPRMLVSALMQFNSTAHSLGTNVRFRWEYDPGSSLYVVYSDGRDTTIGGRYPDVQNAGFTVKFTRLFRN